VYKILENLKGKNQSGDLGIGGKIILNCILNRIWRCGMDSADSEQGPLTGSCEYGTGSLNQ